jgi:hypothetical protein
MSTYSVKTDIPIVNFVKFKQITFQTPSMITVRFKHITLDTIVPTNNNSLKDLQIQNTLLETKIV